MGAENMSSDGASMSEGPRPRSEPPQPRFTEVTGTTPVNHRYRGPQDHQRVITTATAGFPSTARTNRKKLEHETTKENSIGKMMLMMGMHLSLGLCRASTTAPTAAREGSALEGR